MSYNGNIPDHTRGLYIDDDTERSDVIGFVEDRLTSPAVLGDVVVYNFSSHSIDAAALINAASDMSDGPYVIPYQVPGVWGYIVSILPASVSDAPLLTYRSQQGEYHVYPNYRRDRRTDSLTGTWLMDVSTDIRGKVEGFDVCVHCGADIEDSPGLCPECDGERA